jgi:hypothetical protein
MRHGFKLDRRHLNLAMQVVSLIATAWFVWVNSIAPRSDPAGAIIADAISYAAFALVSTALIAWLVYEVVARAGLQGRVRSPEEALAPAIWFAPAMLLAASFSPFSLATSLILVISTTRLLVSRWMHSGARPRMAYTPSRVLLWRAVFAAAASLGLHLAIGALAANLTFPAAALFALSASILTALAIVTGAHTPRRNAALPHSTFGVILTLLLAAGITVVYYRGDDSGSRRAKKGGGSAEGSNDQGRAPGGDFPGVILRTDLEPAAKPRIQPPSLNWQAASKQWNEPRSIPFSGEYWMFRHPSLRPPTNSFRRDGDPLELSFSTTDGFPLLMEARQKLLSPLQTGCCQRIDVAIFSRDLVHGAAWLELFLLDAHPPLETAESLGVAVVTAGGRETLQFALSATRLQQFNEIKVAFHHPTVNQGKSLKLRIERFTFVPRDL